METASSNTFTRNLTGSMRNRKLPSVAGTERSQGRLLEMRSVRYPRPDHVSLIGYCKDFGFYSELNREPKKGFGVERSYDHSGYYI